MNRQSGNKSIFLCFSLVVILLGALVGCTGPQGPAGPVGPAGSAPAASKAVFVVQTQVPSTTKALTAYLSGFAPNGPVVISLQGKWKAGGVDLTDPGLQGGTGTTNAYGAAKITFDIATAITSYKMGPGVYTLMADQGNISVTAPIEIVSANTTAAK